jgi:hypothetical protein
MPGVDSSIRIFEFDTGHETLICRAHVHGIYRLAVDPYSGFFASASHDFTVLLWNPDHRDAIFVAGIEPIVKGEVAFAAKRRRLAIGEIEAFEGHVNSAFVLDLESGREIFRQKLHGGREVGGLALSANGETLIVAVHRHQGSPKGTELSCWDLSAPVSNRGFLNWLGRLLAKLLGHSTPAGGRCVWTRKHPQHNFSDLHWLPGEERLVAATMEDDGDDYRSGVCLLEAHTGAILAKRALPGIGASIAVSPDGARVAVAHGQGDVELLNAADLTLVKTLAPRREQTSNCDIDFSPNGAAVAVGVQEYPGDDVVRRVLRIPL